MGDIKIGFALDASGSMEYGIADTLAGFNQFLSEQAALPGNAYLTLALFDTGVTMRFNGGDLKMVPPLGDKVNPFNPSGGTALYDAVSRVIDETQDWLDNNAGFNGKIVIVVLTDGGENSSTHINIRQLNDRIRDKKEKGWEFVFMGSGGVAWTEGKNIAVDAALNYASNVSSAPAYAAMSNAMTMTRSTGQSMASSLAQAQPADFANIPFYNQDGTLATPTVAISEEP
jgi:hypothetical protein